MTILLIVFTVFAVTSVILNIFTPNFLRVVCQTVGYLFITLRHLGLLTGPLGYT